MLTLCAGDYTLILDPARGGSVAALRWRGVDVLRPSGPGSILNVASFPLVPFSNRIAHGRFAAGERTVELAPNMPGNDHPHPLHGFGWLADWSVAASDGHSATLGYDHAAGAWPWAFAAEQDFVVAEDGVTMWLAVTNQSAEAMPAGLGFHPYFPHPKESVYHALHRGEWQTSDEGLPQSLSEQGVPIDWWGGAPVGTRSLDTIYAHRSGPISIAVPPSSMRILLEPDDALSHTLVYTPQGGDYFCVEPVSHMTDAVNRCVPGQSMRWLSPGERFGVSVKISAQPL